MDEVIDAHAVRVYICIHVLLYTYVCMLVL